MLDPETLVVSYELLLRVLGSRDSGSVVALRGPEGTEDAPTDAAFLPTALRIDAFPACEALRHCSSLRRVPGHDETVPLAMFRQRRFILVVPRRLHILYL